jgi:hypothetical protein
MASATISLNPSHHDSHGSIQHQGPPPANTIIPQIVGLDFPSGGTTLTLTADTGRWDNSPTAYTCNWHFVGSASLGTSCSGLTLDTSTTGVLGSALELDVTASNTAGSTTTRSHWFGPIEASAPIAPIAYEIHSPVPSSIPLPVSPANFLENGHAIYPGCDIPPPAPNLEPAHVWYFDPIAGQTQTAMTTAGVPTASQGHAGHPFKDLNALFDDQSIAGYTRALFGHGRTILPGDTIYIEPGDASHPVGSIVSGNAQWSTSDGTATGSTAWTWIMGDPAAASLPVIVTDAGDHGAIYMINGDSGFLFKNLGVEPAKTDANEPGIRIASNHLGAPEKNMIFEGIHVSAWIGHSDDPWSQSNYPTTGGRSDGTVITASPSIPQTGLQDGSVIVVTLAKGATTFPMTSPPPVGRYLWSNGYYRDTIDSIVGGSSGIPNGTRIVGANGLSAAHFKYVGNVVNAFAPSGLSALVNRGSTTTNQTLPNNNDHAGFWIVAAGGTSAQTVTTWSNNVASVWFTAQPTAGNTFVADGATFTFVSSGATGNQINTGANLPATVSNVITALKASSDTNLSRSTYRNFSTAFSITYPTPGSNLQFNVSSISGATANSWSSVGTALPVSWAVTDAIFWLSNTGHLAHWDGSTWTDIGTPVADLSPCDPVADAATGCPTSNYPGLSGSGHDNVPGCDPLVTLRGTNFGGCPVGTPPAWSGATRAIRGQRLQTTEQMRVLPAGYFNNNDWGTSFSGGFVASGGLNTAGSVNPAMPNLLFGSTCISVKDSWFRDLRNAVQFANTTNSIIYNSRMKWTSADSIDVYSDHRVWAIHNFASDPTQIWDHQDALQYADASGRGRQLLYGNAAIENEFIQNTATDNFFPRSWQGINTTDNVWWGTYVADNVVYANTNGIGIGGKFNAVVHNDMFGTGITVGFQHKVPDGLPIHALIANNVANGVSRDALNSTPCNPVTGDLDTVETNLNIPFTPLGEAANSGKYCRIGSTGAVSSDASPGLYVGLETWTQTDWRTDQTGISPLFKQYDPLAPPVAPAASAGLWFNTSTFTCTQLSILPFACDVGGIGAINERPNSSFSGATNQIMDNINNLFSIPPQGTIDDAYVLTRVDACFPGQAARCGPSGVTWQPGVLVRIRNSTTDATLNWQHTVDPSNSLNFLLPPYNPGVIGAGTNLGAQQPIADHDGKAWSSPPSIGAYENH